MENSQKIPYPETPYFRELAELGRRTMEQARPSLMLAAEAHKHMEETCSTIVEPIRQLQKTLEPTLKTLSDSWEMFKSLNKPISMPVLMPENRSFTMPPISRYPSADEIADAVAERIKQIRKTDKKAVTDKIISIPEGTRWEEISLDNKDNRSFDVFYKDELAGNYDYETLGLVRKNTERKEPNKESVFLTSIALASMPGVKFSPTIERVCIALNISRNACQQVKSSLSKKLQKTFGIIGDPFYPYDPDNGYCPRFKLRPESLLRDNGEPHSSGGILYDGTEDYEENEQ